MDASTSCFDESHDNVVNINSTTQTLPEDEVDDEGGVLVHLQIIFVF